MSFHSRPFSSFNNPSWISIAAWFFIPLSVISLSLSSLLNFSLYPVLTSRLSITLSENRSRVANRKAAACCEKEMCYSPPPPPPNINIAHTQRAAKSHSLARSHSLCVVNKQERSAYFCIQKPHYKHSKRLHFHCLQRQLKIRERQSARERAREEAKEKKNKQRKAAQNIEKIIFILCLYAVWPIQCAISWCATRVWVCVCVCALYACVCVWVCQAIIIKTAKAFFFACQKWLPHAAQILPVCVCERESGERGEGRNKKERETARGGRSVRSVASPFGLCFVRLFCHYFPLFYFISMTVYIRHTHTHTHM